MSTGETAGRYQPVATKTRRKRDRHGTEAELLAAARRLLDRNGVLAGLSLQEVSKEAGINRGLIYQYFGSRRELLRAALRETQWVQAPNFQKVRNLPFGKRRIRVFEESLERRDYLKLITLLLLDGDPEAPVFPELSKARENLRRDQVQGELAVDADTLVMHSLTTATYYGYAILRDALVKETGIDGTDLDNRAVKVFAQMVEGLRHPEVRDLPARSDGCACGASEVFSAASE